MSITLLKNFPLLRPWAILITKLMSGLIFVTLITVMNVLAVINFTTYLERIVKRTDVLAKMGFKRKKTANNIMKIIVNPVWKVSIK